MNKTLRTIEKADIVAGHTAARHHRHPVVLAAGSLSELGDQPPMIALSLGTAAVGALKRDPRLVRTGLRMLLAHAAATGIKAAIKANVDRARPNLFQRERDHRLTEGEENEGPRNSFPSGHTAGALAVARAVAREYPQAASGAYAATGAIAAVQLPRGTHFPIDIAAGAAIGLAAEWLVAQILPTPRFVADAAKAQAAVTALTPP